MFEAANNVPQPRDSVNEKKYTDKEILSTRSCLTCSHGNNVHMLTKKLVLAVNDGNAVRVKKLLQEDGAPQACVTELDPLRVLNVDTKGSPLHLAARRGFTNIVDLFLNYGVNPDLTSLAGGATPFLHACRKAHMPTMRLLIWRGAEVNVFDKHNRTPLHFVCAAGNVEAMFMLIDLGADLDTVDNRGYYPTQLASLTHQTRIAEFLNFREVDGLRHGIGEAPSRANSLYGDTSSVASTRSYLE